MLGAAIVYPKISAIAIAFPRETPVAEGRVMLDVVVLSDRLKLIVLALTWLTSVMLTPSGPAGPRIPEI
jgi:hypothetical protein